MKQVTLNIPDSKYKFFMELMTSLGFVKSNEDIPEEHKQIVRKRIEASSKNPDILLNWDEIKDDFKFD